MRRTSLTLLLLFCLLFASRVPAQKFTGNLRGVVNDQSGAIVPNADITVIDPATGVTRTAKTNEQGEYVVVELPVGTYDVHIKQGQFKESVTRGVAVHVSTTTTVNAQLVPGGATEQVTVEAGSNAVQVETTSAAVGEIVNGQQVRELPLNGRSFVQLTQLQPGVSPANNFDSKNKGLLSGVDFSVNGNPTTNNLFLVDGANNNDVGSNRTILIYPSVESISEFKMLRNAYGPEYGQASGAVINIATRSGGNAFHGSVFYFGRNDALNATEYFAKQSELAARAGGTTLPNNGKNVLRRNDYGYSIGGPIKKDKFFFFWSQEWNKERRGITRSACVPTAAERQGDFTNVSCGSLRGQDLGVVANPDPAGLLFGQIFPLPNLTVPVNGNNWSQSITSPIDWRQESARLDYNLTKSNVIMLRYTQDHWNNPAPNAGPAAGLWGDDPFPSIEGSWTQPSKQAVAKLTSAFTQTMVNDVAFAYSNNRINIVTGGTNPGLENQLASAVPTVFPENLKTHSAGIPVIWGGITPYLPNGNGFGPDLWLISPWNNTLDLYTVRDDLSKVHGTHTFKMGVFLGFNGKNEDISANGAGERPQFGSFSVQGPSSNNFLKDLLTPGTLLSMTEVSSNVRAKLRWRDYEAYFGDTWRVRRNLTLELGVRWSSLNAPYQPDDQITSFDPSLYDPTKPASDACNGIRVVPGTDPCGASNRLFGTNFSSGVPGVGRSLVENNHHLFAPRLGASWDPFGTGNTAVRLGMGQFFQRERVNASYVLADNAPFAVTASNVIRTLDTNGVISGTPTTSPAGGRDPRDLLPNSWQWNFSVEQALAKDTALEIGYIGNRGIHLTSQQDINQVTDPAARLQEAFCNTCSTFRPFSNFGSLAFIAHRGDSNYHALQTLFRTRYKAAQIQAAYTWSHTITNIEEDNADTIANGGSLNQSALTSLTDSGVDRGNSNLNRPHIFVVNAVITAPALNGQTSFVKGAFGGWEFAVIDTAASGNSRSVFVNGVTDINGGSLNSLSGTGLNANNRPNLTGVSCNSGTSGQQIFNPAAFTLVGYQIGTIGNSPRGVCEGPKLFDTDFAVYKNFQATERFKIQFRIEAFNLFNTANFNGNSVNRDLLNGVKVACGNTPCSPTNNIITSATPNATFGQATGTRGPRELQYALKFIF
jgi:hypothetical protein